MISVCSTPVRIALAAAVAGGCTQVEKTFEIPDNTRFSYVGKRIVAPNGCVFVGDSGSPIQTLVRDDGRERIAVFPVSQDL